MTMTVENIFSDLAKYGTKGHESLEFIESSGKLLPKTKPSHWYAFIIECFKSLFHLHNQRIESSNHILKFFEDNLKKTVDEVDTLKKFKRLCSYDKSTLQGYKNLRQKCLIEKAWELLATTQKERLSQFETTLQLKKFQVSELEQKAEQLKHENDSAEALLKIRLQKLEPPVEKDNAQEDITSSMLDTSSPLDPNDEVGPKEVLKTSSQEIKEPSDNSNPSTIVETHQENT